MGHQGDNLIACSKGELRNTVYYAHSVAILDLIYAWLTLFLGWITVMFQQTESMNLKNVTDFVHRILI